MKRTRPPFVIGGIVAAILLVAHLRRHDPGFCVIPAPHEVAYVMPSPHPAPRPSEGCGKPLESREEALVAGGEKRTYRLSLPTDYDPSRPRPLVLYFHGNGGSAASSQASVPFPSAIAVYPQAVVRRVWADHFAPHWGRTEDLPFFDALVDDLAAHLCIDRARIFVVGWSAGGYFANQLACVRPGVVSAFFAFASGGPEDATCSAPVPGLVTHDRDDHAVLVTEGRKSRDAWRATDRCADRSHDEGGCTIFDGCAASFAYCETSGNGHPVAPSVLESTRRSIAAF